MTLAVHPDVINQQTIDEVVRFHGHQCPGLAIGIQTARLAIREVGCHCPDEEVVAVVGNDMCAVDGIQYMTGWRRSRDGDPYPQARRSGPVHLVL
jgi:formylmethanofuran dehydrogenase subunit E